ENAKTRKSENAKSGRLYEEERIPGTGDSWRPCRMPFWFPSRFRSFALSRSPVGAFRADVMGGLMACRWLQVVLLRRGGVTWRGVADAGEEGVGGFDGDGPGGVGA